MFDNTIDFNSFYKQYLETLLGIDESIGQLLDHLKSVGLDKSTLVIASGTGSITLVATSSNGQTVTFTGDITFNGGGNATLVIQGKSFTIQL